MKFYTLRDEDKRFLFALLYATGLILLWRGIWETSAVIPVLENPWVVLFIGLFILTMTGLIYREFDMLSQRVYNLSKILNDVIVQTKRGAEYRIVYYDAIRNDTHSISSKRIHNVETEFMIVEQQGHETFIPLRRIVRIDLGKTKIWQR